MSLRTTKAGGKHVAAVLLLMLLCCCSAFAQSQAVQGVVTDNEGALSDTVQQVTIQATDRFRNVFRKDVDIKELSRM